MNLLLLVLYLAGAEGGFSSIWVPKGRWKLDDGFPHPLKPTKIYAKFLNNNICKTEACQKAADRILQNMKKTVDPCTDFYEFSCGRVAESHELFGNPQRWDQFEDLYNTTLRKLKEILETDEASDPTPVIAAKSAYRVCVKDEKETDLKGRIKETLDLMDEIAGGWPIVGGTLHESFNWVDTMAKIMTSTEGRPIFYVTVSHDVMNTSTHVLRIDQASLPFPRGILLKPQTYKNQIEQFKTKMFNLTWEYALVANKVNVTQDSVRKGIDDMMEFGMKLAEINWLSFLKALFPTNNNTIQFKTRLLVREVDYVYKVLALVNSTSPEVLANYMLWDVAVKFPWELTKRVGLDAFRMDGTSGSHEIEDGKTERWSDCIKFVQEYLPLPIGFSYVEKYFDHTARLEALEMANNIKQTFYEEIEKLGWMDEDSKEAARSKLQALDFQVGYPTWFSNSSAMEDLYQGLPWEVSSNHFSNMLSLVKLRFAMWFEQLKKQPNRSEWILDLSPVVVNAFYTPLTNYAYLPAAILQPPFFYKEQPEVLNYGGIGVVIAHELTHAFDITGRKFDKEGNYAMWWTDKTAESYTEKANCYIAQYGGYRVTQLDDSTNSSTYVNGKLSLSENIADNGGMNAALTAYRNYAKKQGPQMALPGLEAFTGEQLFFIAFANNWCEYTSTDSLLTSVLTDSHSPSRYRVQGVLDNSPSFRQAFNCPVTSKAEHICDMW